VSRSDAALQGRSGACSPASSVARSAQLHACPGIERSVGARVTGRLQRRSQGIFRSCARGNPSTRPVAETQGSVPDEASPLAFRQRVPRQRDALEQSASLRPRSCVLSQGACRTGHVNRRRRSGPRYARVLNPPSTVPGLARRFPQVTALVVQGNANARGQEPLQEHRRATESARGQDARVRLSQRSCAEGHAVHDGMATPARTYRARRSGPKLPRRKTVAPEDRTRQRELHALVPGTDTER